MQMQIVPAPGVVAYFTIANIIQEHLPTYIFNHFELLIK